MSDLVELKPCPFCGGSASMVRGGPGNFFVQCEECRSAGDDGSKEYGIAAWNRRAPDPELSRLSALVAEWRTMESAPKDGSVVWAWLGKTGIRAVRWGAAEEWAEIEGGDPADYEDCWVEADDEGEVWSPRWWKPYDAICNPNDNIPPVSQLKDATNADK